MDEFDFDDIDDTTNKKPTNKTNEKQPASKYISFNHSEPIRATVKMMTFSIFKSHKNPKIPS